MSKGLDKSTLVNSSLALQYYLSTEVNESTLGEFIDCQELKNCACGGNCYNSLDNRSTFEMLNEQDEALDSYRKSE